MGARPRSDHHRLAPRATAFAAPLGAVAAPYGDADRASFALHMLDEQIHHGAEVALLRDLYANRAHDSGARQQE